MLLLKRWLDENNKRKQQKFLTVVVSSCKDMAIFLQKKKLSCLQMDNWCSNEPIGFKLGIAYYLQPYLNKQGKQLVSTRSTYPVCLFLMVSPMVFGDRCPIDQGLDHGDKEADWPISEVAKVQAKPNTSQNEDEI